MIACPELLVKPAQDAFIPIPENLEDYDVEEYPHWHVYLMLQLGSSMPDARAHFHNAHVVSRISDEDIFDLTGNDAINRGFKVGYSYETHSRGHHIAILWVIAVVCIISTIFYILR